MVGCLRKITSAMITAALHDLLQPYDPVTNYWKNSAAAGYPLSASETIAIDCINDGIKAVPNRLAEYLVQRFGWDAVFGNNSSDSTNLVMDNSSTELYDGYESEAVKQERAEALKSEHEYGVPYGDYAIKADADYICSDEYSAKFGSISSNPKVVEAVSSVGRRSVMENSGTKMESMYLIDANTGEIIASVENPADKIESGVCYTPEFRNALNAAKNEGRTIIALHNHPEGYPPSADDIMKAAENGYDFGIVCGSNGQVYMYRPCEEMTKEMCDMIQAGINFRALTGYDVDRAYREAFEEVMNLYREILGENKIDYTILR